MFPSVSRYHTRVLCIFPVVAAGEGRAVERRIGSKEENTPPAPREDRVPPPPTDTASPLPDQVSSGPRRGVGIRRCQDRGLGLPSPHYRGHGLCEARRVSWGRGRSATPLRSMCGGGLWRASRVLGCGAVSAPRWWGLRRSRPFAPQVSGIWGRRAVLELSVLLQALCMLGGWGMFYVGLPLSKHPSRSRGSSVGQGSGYACPSQLPLLALGEGGSPGGNS